MVTLASDGRDDLAGDPAQRPVAHNLRTGAHVRRGGGRQQHGGGAHQMRPEAHARRREAAALEVGDGAQHVALLDRAQSVAQAAGFPVPAEVEPQRVVAAFDERLAVQHHLARVRTRTRRRQRRAPPPRQPRRQAADSHTCHRHAPINDTLPARWHSTPRKAMHDANLPESGPAGDRGNPLQRPPLPDDVPAQARPSPRDAVPQSLTTTTTTACSAIHHRYGIDWSLCPPADTTSGAQPHTEADAVYFANV